MGVCLGTFQAEAQDNGQEAPPPKRPKIEQIGDHTYKLGEIILNSQSRELRFPALVNQHADPVEYFLVPKGGKDHESILNTQVEPLELQLALLLLKYEPFKLQDYYRADEPPPDVALPLLGVFVEQKTDGGRKLTPAEKFVFNIALDSTMPDTRWLYNGSRFFEGKFAAQMDGVHIALFQDGSSLINSLAEGNVNDQIWYPNKEALPPVGEEVTVILRPAELKAKTEEAPQREPGAGDEAGSTANPKTEDRAPETGREAAAENGSE